MNKIFRVVWNSTLGVWQCVAEIATARGKQSCRAQAGALPSNVNGGGANRCSSHFAGLGIGAGVGAAGSAGAVVR